VDSFPLPGAFERTPVDFRVDCRIPRCFRTKPGGVTAAPCPGPSRESYGHSRHLPLRAAIARHIAGSRGHTAADDVTVTRHATGARYRRALAARDTVAIGALYPAPAALRVTRRASWASPWTVRAVVDALPRRARLVYVTPSHQYPRRRDELAAQLAPAWAERHGVAIVEDYDSEFRFHDRPIEPLHLLDTAGRIIYVGTFSKTLLPTLRLGFVVTPPSLTSAVQKPSTWRTGIRRSYTSGTAQFLDDGGFAAHRRCRIYRVGTR
jgi:GntR family transcriptional regulator/MocR family aminotransferase